MTRRTKKNQELLDEEEEDDEGGELRSWKRRTRMRMRRN